ncbi:RNase HII [Tessaracoccus bendigoensis DSM 12906]|uniref:Ribonuclease HII n=1 Tax=Tessaracoccus bendigoensis DSM 12906 TaxID=1123357 RepID=A0A1M6H9Q3_9ACTN|nr:ribonuclease HII [Tessaracoccus bendigoensis]SHJ18896.1 RNase HII [Tessaracoccus bendigoensis DSM 12906]
MIRPGRGAYGYERALARAGLGPVAGADEAGRGACAGPLVAAATILDPARPIQGLDDSKALSAVARERLYEQIQRRAVAVAVAIVGPEECDALGMHQADLHGLRRAVGRLEVAAGFVITDGFPVDGLGAPGLAMWKGDKVAACVSAASIVAKVTRDQIMTRYDETYPEYGFAVHKGYCTAAHQQALEAAGPSRIHRWCFDNVARLAPGGRDSLTVLRGDRVGEP